MISIMNKRYLQVLLLSSLAFSSIAYASEDLNDILNDSPPKVVKDSSGLNSLKMVKSVEKDPSSIRSDALKKALVQIEELKRSLEEKGSSIENLKNKNSLMADKIESLQSKSDLVDSAVSLEGKLSKLMDDIDSAVALKSELNKKLKSLKAISKIYAEDVATQKIAKDSLESAVKKMNVEHDELKADITVIKLEKRSLNKKIKELKEEFSKISSWALDLDITPIAIVGKKQSSEVSAKTAFYANVMYDGKLRTIREGMYLNGWLVVKIASDYIICSSNSRAYKFYVGDQL